MAGPSPSQYGVPQGALPPTFYNVQQPVMYSYEDLQLLQQRLPLMQQGQIPIPVSREGLISPTALYSVTDATKYPTVSSTMSQQQQAMASGAYMTAMGAPAPYPYYMYPPSMAAAVPGMYQQYGAPALFSIPGSGGAHQYPGQAKLVYGNASSYYDSVPQEYKTAYASSSLTQSKLGGASVGTASSGTDMSSYKNPLGKVGRAGGMSTGTPPPFNVGSSATSPLTPNAYSPMLIPTLQAGAAAQHQASLMPHQLNQDGDVTVQHSSKIGNYGGASKGGISGSYWGAK